MNVLLIMFMQTGTPDPDDDYQGAMSVGWIISAGDCGDTRGGPCILPGLLLH
jgi:hypothetical protein